MDQRAMLLETSCLGSQPRDGLGWGFRKRIAPNFREFRNIPRPWPASERKDKKKKESLHPS